MNLRKYFWLFALVLIIATVVHSMWATSLDSFTIDEPYHIAAGASYLRWHDFRVNPEHPPLVKLVAGMAEPASVLHLTPPPVSDDKIKERIYTQTAVFLDSNADAVQRRARIALYLFHACLLALLAWLLYRVFGPALALFALLLLALDPTVSAHMPVVMTDLPMALLGACCFLLAVLAVRQQKWLDWLLFGCVTGLLLATKHSAPLLVLPVVLGSLVALAMGMRRGTAKPRAWLGLAAAICVAVAVLWATYGFRYHESNVRDAKGQYVETFNRRLDDKITDLRSPMFRSVLTGINRVHLLPRAYTWGLADTLRAGVEGRPIWVAAYGRSYRGKAPAWVLFAFLIVKLPLGFILLTGAGITALARRRFTPQWTAPLLCAAGLLAVEMAWLAHNGIFYAGIRHFLFVVPLLALLAAAGAVAMLGSTRWWVRGLVLVAVVSIAVDVLPQRRIWEYHNLLAGGTPRAWRYFNNESVDLGQRSRDITAYYNLHVRPARPMLGYWFLYEDMRRNNIEEWDPKPEEVANGYVSGWIIASGSGLALRNWDGVEVLKTAKPEAQMGGIQVYHGTYFMPKVAAGVLNGHAMKELHFTEHPDKAMALRYLELAVGMNHELWASEVELGNLAIEKHDKPTAVRWFRMARENAKDAPDVQKDLAEELALLEKTAPEAMKPMRSPASE